MSSSLAESGVVTEFSSLGSKLVSLAEVASKFSVIAGIVTTIAVSTIQATCLTNDLHNRMQKAFSIDMDEVREALAIYPALATVTRFTSSPVTNILDLVRHGIIVQTTYTPPNSQKSRPIYFYIGGVSSEWINNRRTQELIAFQAGSRFILETSLFNGQIEYALNSQYPIIVAPLKPSAYYKYFVNPPNTVCPPTLPADVLNIIQSSSFAWATFIPNYVGSILGELSRYNSRLYYLSSHKWILRSLIESTLKSISEQPPLFYEGLAILPQLEQFGLGTIDIYNYYVYDFTNTNPPFAKLYLQYPFPLLNGAPAYTDMLCTGNCSGLGLAGFVVAPHGEVFPSEISTVLQAQLIPPPNDFSFNGIMQYASQLGQYTWVDQLINNFFNKAFQVISILVTNFGWLEQEAEKAVYALEWFGSEFEKTAEEIAQDIVNEFNSPPHSESQHTDQAGMEVHYAYMCVRFGLCE